MLGYRLEEKLFRMAKNVCEGGTAKDEVRLVYKCDIKEKRGAWGALPPV